ncbi:MAG: SET domain-containing protein-lysine N-methyltransferase [Flavobacterium sp.]|nr:MAG: SET domain-containing protein-lysine N-methyltransferase [Flavobacterium sp.]
MINLFGPPGSNNATFSVDIRNERVKVKASRNIWNGQEIFLSYGHSYKFNEGTHHTTVTCNKKK